MNLDVRKFYQATNPSKTLDVNKPEDEKYYIDFFSVRGGQIIEELRDSITWADESNFTCNLFTGHIGCGKSTELLRLKKDLEEEGFHVVYFESDEDLDIGNVDISDILLAIARRVSQSLEAEKSQERSDFFQSLFQGAKKLLLTEIQLSAEGKIPGVGDLGIEIGAEDDVKVSLSTVLGKISTTTKKNRNLHDRLRAYLEPKTDGILNVLNQGLFEPAAEKLKQLGKRGLVVIVDNLDRLLRIPNSFGRFQPEYIFADRGTDLRRLQCHIIYTMPLALRYSNDYNIIRERFKINAPAILPMVLVKSRDGTVHQEGMKLLRQMVLARVPNTEGKEPFELVQEVFGSQETLDYLCQMSGGHVRNLLIILNGWIMKGKKLPLSREKLEAVIVEQRNEMLSPGITEDEWKLILRIKQEKQLAGDDDYEKLIHNRFVYEYRDSKGSWYDINPVLEEAAQLKNSN
ncbi:MAG: ATP-binding protein [Xenococcaceae cyanobacterium]